MARLANALVTYRAQCDARDSNRDKSSDGWIASKQHSRQNPTSDHEPNSDGVVTAVDITGQIGHEALEKARLSRDPRIKYGISKRRMFSSYPKGEYPPFTWRPYNGSNPHDKHAHLSVMADPALYDDARQWRLWGTQPNQQEDEMPNLKLIRIDGGDIVWVCNGVELQKIGSASAADAMWPDWRTRVQDVSSKSVLAKLPRRDP